MDLLFLRNGGRSNEQRTCSRQKVDAVDLKNNLVLGLGMFTIRSYNLKHNV